MDRNWLTRHPAVVAFDLIGCHLTVERDGECTTGAIVEAEAYSGLDDPASHSYRMKGPREVMSRAPGTIYVYRSYGIHTCFNIVAHRENEPGGVLIRAIEPVAGTEAMRERRGGVPDRQLGRGPGNVGQALGILFGDIGADLFEGEVFSLEKNERPPEVWSSSRIGISKAVNYPWRFFDPASKAVSAHRRGDPTSPQQIHDFIIALSNPIE